MSLAAALTLLLFRKEQGPGSCSRKRDRKSQHVELLREVSKQYGTKLLKKTACESDFAHSIKKLLLPTIYKSTPEPFLTCILTFKLRRNITKTVRTRTHVVQNQLQKLVMCSSSKYPSISSMLAWTSSIASIRRQEAKMTCGVEISKQT